MQAWTNFCYSFFFSRLIPFLKIFPFKHSSFRPTSEKENAPFQGKLFHQFPSQPSSSVNSLYELASLSHIPRVSLSTGPFLSGFKDAASVSDWAMDAMEWAVSTGLMEGDANKLTPASNATRCQSAALLMRFNENIVKAEIE